MEKGWHQKVRGSNFTYCIALLTMYNYIKYKGAHMHVLTCKMDCLSMAGETEGSRGRLQPSSASSASELHLLFAIAKWEKGKRRKKGRQNKKTKCNFTPTKLAFISIFLQYTYKCTF